MSAGAGARIRAQGDRRRRQNESGGKRRCDFRKHDQFPLGAWANQVRYPIACICNIPHDPEFGRETPHLREVFLLFGRRKKSPCCLQCEINGIAGRLRIQFALKRCKSGAQDRRYAGSKISFTAPAFIWFVVRAKRLVRRSSKSEGGSVPADMCAGTMLRIFARPTEGRRRLTPPAPPAPCPSRRRAGPPDAPRCAPHRR